MFVGLLIFFFDIPVEARFLLTSVLFALFAIPLFVVVRERPAPDAEKLTVAVVVASWQQLRTTIRAREGGSRACRGSSSGGSSTRTR